MTIRDYLSVLRQRALVVLITVALTTGAAVLLQMRTKPTYQAKSKILVVPVTLTGDDVLPGSRYQAVRGATTEAELVKSTEVAKRVIKRLKLDRPPFNFQPRDIIESSEIVTIQYSDILVLTVTASDPQLASDLANAIPEEYINHRREQAIKEAQLVSERIAGEMGRLLESISEVDQLLNEATEGGARYDVLRSQRQQLAAQVSSLEVTRQKLLDQSPLKNRGVGEVVEFATAPEGRSNSDLMRTALLGIIIGIPLALGLALLLDAMSDTIKTKEEAERIIGVDALGVIPLTPDWRSGKPQVVTRDAPYSAAAEAFRTLRINIDSKGPSSDHRQIMFSSPGSGEGKTTTSANLAVAFAEAGRSALVVSADLRRPRLHQMFSVEASPGLADYLLGELQDHEVVREEGPNLFVLPSGTVVDRPDQLFSRPDIRDLLQDIHVHRAPGRRPRPRNDENGTNAPAPEQNEMQTVIATQPHVTLFDAPAVLGAAEVSALARVVDGVVLVVQAGITRREAAARAAEQIRKAGGTIIGLVVVGVRVDEDYSVYPPFDDQDNEVEGSTWSKVVGTLKR